MFLKEQLRLTAEVLTDQHSVFFVSLILTRSAGQYRRRVGRYIGQVHAR